MAITTVKSTYSLDVDTVRTLERVAQDWGVSKSEALRRAIRSLAQETPSAQPTALEALDELQASLELSEEDTAAWIRSTRAERRASSMRGEKKK